jgi:hypothetical protein
MERRATTRRICAVDRPVGAAVYDRADAVPGLTRRTACGHRDRDRGEPGQDQLGGEDQHGEWL